MEEAFILKKFGIQNELHLINILSTVMIVQAGLVWLSLQFVTSPYGRFARSSWGFGVSARVSWFLQELPSFTVPCVALLYAREDVFGWTPNAFLLMLFLIHYFQRTFIFPFCIQGGKPTPFSIMLMALSFCSLNGYMQGRYITKFAYYDKTWYTSPQFVVGVTMFFVGLAINLHSDHILRNLRRPGETGYKIPRGGMFEYVSGANFLGEIIEWGGFALATWSYPALAFLVSTTANIGARACHHHRWYLEKFEDYPKSRKAIIPFVW